MKMEVVFNNNFIEYSNYSVDEIYRAIKKAFFKHDLPSILDNEILTFRDRRREDDFANMWNAITSLMKSQWFLKCASSCVFYDDEGTVEDVLSQAWKFK